MTAFSEEKKEKIEKGAREILKNFSLSLARVKMPKEDLNKNVGGFRKEESGSKPDEEFRELMFANAPEKEDDFIIAEKKKW